MVSDFEKPDKRPFSDRNIKFRVQWFQKCLHWGNNEWRNVVFNEQAHICLGTGDNVRTFLWRRSHENFNEECVNTKKKFPKCFIIWSCITYQGIQQLANVFRNVKADVSQEIFEKFFTTYP